VQSLFPKGVDEILLYKAPKHLSFRIACYVVGILFFVGGWSWAAVLRESAERATLPNRTAGAEKDGAPAEKLRLGVGEAEFDSERDYLCLVELPVMPVLCT